MGDTKLTSKLFLLEPDQASQVVALAKELRTSQSTLAREAFMDLLRKYEKAKGKGRKPK